MADFVDSPIGDIPEIPVDSGGLFTPSSAYAIKLSADLVNKCVALAEAKDTDFTAKMDALTNATTGFLVTRAAADVTAGSISAPTPTEPSMTVGDTSTALVFNNFSTQAAAVISDAATKFTSFWSTYFPDNATTYDAAEAYLLAAISNTTSGIVPAAIKTAMLEDSRAQVLAEAARAEADLYEAQSAKRHRFPPGAAAGNARRITQTALDNIAASSRAIAVKDFELSHSTALESVRMALLARSAAMSATQQYLATVVAQGYGTGAQIVVGAHGAEVAKLSAAYQAYAGRVSAAELALRASQADKTLTFEADKLNQGKTIQETDLYNKAFLAEAQLTGQQLISMLNNLRAGSNVQFGVSDTTVTNY